jgi:hypothetical protein
VNRSANKQEDYGISTSLQLDVPAVSNKAMLMMVHLLATGQTQIIPG